MICTPPPTRNGNPFVKAAKRSAVLQELEHQRQILISKQNVQNVQTELLTAYSKTVNTKHVPPFDIAAFLSTFDSVGKANVDAKFEITKKLEDLEAAIKEEIDNPTAPAETSHLMEFKVRVVIFSEEGSAAQVSLVYGESCLVHYAKETD